MREEDLHLAISQRRIMRRHLLLGGGVALAGAAWPRSGLATWNAHLVQATPESHQPLALSPEELETLRAVVGRLIPTDDLGPGADVAGVHIFIDRGLAGPNRRFLPAFHALLTALQSAGFAAATVEEQDKLLTELEAGTLPRAPEGAFPLLLEQTREGMFGDPVYGGNQDFAGWDLIGYPGVKLLWTEAEQAIDAEVKATHTSVAQFGGKGW